MALARPEQVDRAALAELGEGHLRRRGPTAASEDDKRTLDKRGMTLVEDPISRRAVPPGDGSQAGSDDLEHPARAIERQSANPAGLHGDHVLPRHRGTLRQRSLRQALTLPNEAQQPAEAFVVGSGHGRILAVRAYRWLAADACYR
jgi:hypothetical protein